MLKIITQTPIYVWPLFAYLVFIGIKASKSHIIPLRALFITPAIFSVWSFYSVLTRHGVFSLELALWSMSILLGVLIGSLITQHLNMKSDKIKRRIELPGSWIPLILSMSIFSIKYSLGMIYATHTDLVENGALLLLELTTTMISGVFAGRTIACLRKYRSSSHVNLV